ncbi:MAG: 4-hydroxy-tetrahydrodipicolinate reductase [Sedimentisphaerales bacterium]|nr:4-hydroxy-tetrahydrodipicolinate reductase [Sedimentisphaerales bacterium]
MGLRTAALAHESGQFTLAAALERRGHERIGQDIGSLAGIGSLGVPVADRLEAPSVCDVIVDFSLPAGTETWIAYCREHRIPLVVGTTGLSDDQRQKLKDAAGDTPILLAANMSLGVNLLFALVGEVARKLGDSYDPEIIETHHRFKRDAPSGTALELARRLAEAQGWPFPACLVHGRRGPDAVRDKNSIGMHAVRAGDTVGEHRVIFSALGETIELRHSAHTRDTFARGALRAAAWLVGQKPGLYGMADVLGL